MSSSGFSMDSSARTSEPACGFFWTCCWVLGQTFLPPPLMHWCPASSSEHWGLPNRRGEHGVRRLRRDQTPGLSAALWPAAGAPQQWLCSLRKVILDGDTLKFPVRSKHQHPGQCLYSTVQQLLQKQFWGGSGLWGESADLDSSTAIVA